MAELKKARSQEKVEQAQKALNVMREQLKGKNWKPTQSVSEEPSSTFAIGQKVWLSGLGLQGVIVASPETTDNWKSRSVIAR